MPLTLPKKETEPDNLNKQPSGPELAAQPPTEDQIELEKVSKQILLDCSSLNRNIVCLPHKLTRKLLKKSVVFPQIEDTLYSEPANIRQFIGLTEWNSLLKKESIPK